MLESRRSRIIASSAAVVGVGTATLVAINLSGDGEMEGPPECPPLYQIDFEDGTYDPWLALGPAVIEVVDNDGNSVLSVTGRSDTWHGFESPTGGFQAGTMYDLSFDVLLESTADVRFIAYDEGTANTYNWVGTTEVEAGEWTTITGTFAFSETGQAASRVYIEVNSFDDYQVDNVLVEPAVCLVGGPEPGTIILETDFEDGLDGWEPRGDDAGPPNVSISNIAFEGESAAIVTDRTSQGSGIGHEMTELMQPGAAYTVNAWVRFPEGVETDEIWLTMRRTEGGEHTYDTLGQFVEIPNDDWVEVNATFTVGTYEQAFLYFETSYNGTNVEDFLVDNVSIVVPEPLTIEDLTPLMDTMNIPVGVAIDVRETAGAYSELVTKHFNQITAENHMKPDAWYNANGEFSPHPDAVALMNYAAANDMGVYGHVLVWHAQTPEWFFQRDGQPLTDSAADQELLRERMREHIFNIAQFLSDEWGLFGSDTNPMVAWDVVNEVIDDSSEYADGMRRSEWYAVLGEEFVDLAFIYADEAFNDVYAADGVDRPVTLFINDYNSEFADKRARYLALIERSIARGAPIDGVGHQLHLNLTVPASNVEQTLRDTQRLGLPQVVTELDVPTGTPVSDALWVEQGYYYRDVFRTLRAFEDDLYSVTLWGLYDTRSWRDANGGPLLFDGLLQAKPAYFGAIDGELPIPPRVVSMFRGSVPLNDAAFDAIEWKQLPLFDIAAGTYFQTRWEPDYATIYVTVDDATPTAEDAIEFEMGDQTFTVHRDGTADVDAVVRERDGGYDVVAHVPFDSPLGQGRVARLDVRVSNDGVVSGWNQPGELGFLNLYEPVSYLEVVYTDTAPVIDGEVDGVWSAADVVTTDVQVQGSNGAGAEVRTLWKDNMLYVLMEVTDAAIDVSGSDPWIQDTVEIYLDAGNAKNGSYRPIDTQIRINAENVHSYGTGDEAEQAARVDSVVVLTDTGYRVEVAIDMLNSWGAGSFHGLDFQVNDAVNGNRTSVRNWADPSDAAYQSTARWGVGQLVVR